MNCGQYITHIDLSMNNKMIGNATLIHIGKSCPNLKEINLGSVQYFKSGLKALADHCTQINSLILDDLYNNSINRNFDELARLFAKNQIKNIELSTDLLDRKILK